MSNLINFPQKNLKTFLIISAPTLCLAGFCYWRYYRKQESVVLKKEKSCKSLKEEGNQLFKIGKYEAALQLYTEAIDLCSAEDNNNLELLYQNRAAVWEKLNHHKNVIHETTLALKLNPKYVKALHRRSKAYKATGFLDEALEDVTCVCILEQFSSPSSVQLADDILKEIGAQEGQRLLKERETSGKGVAPSAHTCTSYLRGFKNCPVSCVVSSGSVEMNDDGSPYYKALHLLSTHNYDSIISLCEQELANESSVHRTEAHYLAGTFRFLYGHKEQETCSDFEYVVKNGDKVYKASALIKMASHYALVDKEQLCEGCFDESQRVWPDNVDLFHHRGQVLLTRGALPQALELMTKAADLAPDYPIAVATKWYVQYRILCSSGDVLGAEQCVREFERMVVKFDTSPDVFSLYGQILMETQQFTLAEEAFARVSALDKKNAGVLVHRAMSKFQRDGDVNSAIETLKSAVEIDARNEFVYETLGTLYLQNGDLTPAIHYIGKALSLARSLQELTILSSLKKAAEVQKKVKETMGLSVEKGFFK